MAEYIDRRKIRDEVCKDCTYRVRADGCVYQVLCDKLLVAFIEAEPAAEVVPVVRCRECKHFRLWGGYDQRHYCSNNKGIAGIVASTDFCSYGER